MRALGSHGFESCPRSECRLGFLTQGNGFLVGGLLMFYLLNTEISSDIHQLVVDTKIG
ncbi:hypothetical protein E2C01_080174 [Portunus trituberculatus]|uniref:Uncharacterized protein n=1 Tax=Portunus trituberculatus TaxID=210409 RepID=A0A5B7INK3_PORTR|nr:hypothetical protein [Portunus trituberculatus]